MLRRLLAALLVAAIAMPLPAVAVASMKGCPMKEHAGMAAGHDCCCKDKGTGTTSGREGHKGCPMPASPASGGCDCVVKADPGRQPAEPVASAPSSSPLPAPTVTALLLPAALSTPQRVTRAVHVADPPPSPGLVSRPRLCTWIL